MNYDTPHLGSWPAKVVLKISNKLRSNKVYSQEAVAKANAREAELRRRRRNPNGPKVRASHDEVNELGERDLTVFSDDASTLVDRDIHRKDHTDYLHRLAHHDSFDSLVDLNTADLQKLRDPYFDSSKEGHHAFSEKHERLVADLPKDLWEHIASYLGTMDAASLAVSSKTLAEKLGNEPLRRLGEPGNEVLKVNFLHQNYDHRMPNHLLCHQCGAFHRRLNPGREVFKADYVANPLVTCPKVRTTVLPRTRIAHLRQLPYGHIQLALREAAYGPEYGLNHEILARQWTCKDSGWQHRTRYMVHDGHLLMRVVSQIFAPPDLTATGLRHLLYDREEYTPFFSVCHHWRDGELTKMCKCALAHVPRAPESYFSQLKKAPKISQTAAHPQFIITGCDYCRPARRCPQCPSEYLVEIQMCEDKKDPVTRFKHSIVVTRWADLGDGSSPYTSPEWAAIHGKSAGDEHGAYESFSHIGRRAVSGVFESRVAGSIPGQRMLSLNPKMEHNGEDGEEGDDWY